MRYVLSLDVAKGKSTAGLFEKGREGTPLIRPHDIPHTRSALAALAGEAERLCGERPAVAMESTGNYGLGAARFFAEAGFEVITVNPLITARGGGDTESLDYCNKKRSGGKHHYVAVIACATKLLRKVFYRYRDSQGALAK